MKKILLTLNFLFLIFNFSYAQLLDFPYSCWQQKAVYQYDFSMNFQKEKNVTTYLYDTVVCSKIFKKCLFEQTYNGIPIPDSYIYLRNDSGKIYYCDYPHYPTCPDSSILIMDFTLVPGDTFSFYGWMPILDTVASVSYVTIGTSLRKKITFNSYFEIIDGIGDDNYGLLYWSAGWEGDGHILICQLDSQGTVFSNPNITGPFSNDPSGHLHQCDSIPAIPHCYIPAGIYSLQEISAAFSPNPFTDQAAISFSKEVDNAIFSLYNLLGEKVAETTGINGESFQFSRGSLQSGVYVFEVMEKEKKIGRGKAVVY